MCSHDSGDGPGRQITEHTGINLNSVFIGACILYIVFFKNFGSYQINGGAGFLRIFTVAFYSYFILG